jgi:hypothetical protein
LYRYTSEEAGEAGEVDKCQALVAAAETLRTEMEKDLDDFRREQSRFEVGLYKLNSEAVCCSDAPRYKPDKSGIQSIA